MERIFKQKMLKIEFIKQLFEEKNISLEISQNADSKYVFSDKKGILMTTDLQGLRAMKCLFEVYYKISEIETLNFLYFCVNGKYCNVRNISDFAADVEDCILEERRIAREAFFSSTTKEQRKGYFDLMEKYFKN